MSTCRLIGIKWHSVLWIVFRVVPHFASFDMWAITGAASYLMLDLPYISLFQVVDYRGLGIHQTWMESPVYCNYQSQQFAETVWMQSSTGTRNAQLLCIDFQRLSIFSTDFILYISVSIVNYSIIVMSACVLIDALRETVWKLAILDCWYSDVIF